MDNKPLPLVSIITCFLNVEKFLAEMIQSVLAQDYANWELILVDDGSTDNSTAIARQYAAEFPTRIFYHNHPGHKNKGASASRNVAIKLSQGEFLTFLDGDDVFLPQFLSHQVKLQQRFPAASLICEATEYWYDWTPQEKANTVVQIGVAPERLYYPAHLALKLYPLNYGASPCICGMLLKKSVAEKHGLFDEAFKGMYDDQVLMMKIFLNEPVYISSACHNRYRQRPGSLVHSSHAFGGYHRTRKRFLNWLFQYLQEQNLSYPEVTKLVAENLAYSRPYYLLAKDFLWLVKKRLQGKKVLFH
jgi:glycosyltransferase involved in cell wall biosynthesis